MFKVIAKTALKTLAVVALLVVLAFGIASIGFPSAMAGLFEKLGNYSFATGYASMSYTYSKDVSDLARCVQDSVLAENDRNTVRFGDMLLSHGDFDGFCAEEGERLNLDYLQYICGKIACAKYRTGNTDGAVETAKTALSKCGAFPANNAAVQLVLEVAKSGDAAAAEKIKTSLEYTPTESEAEYFDTVINILNSIINQGAIYE